MGGLNFFKDLIASEKEKAIEAYKKGVHEVVGGNPVFIDVQKIRELPQEERAAEMEQQVKSQLSSDEYQKFVDAQMTHVSGMTEERAMKVFFQDNTSDDKLSGSPGRIPIGELSMFKLPNDEWDTRLEVSLNLMNEVRGYLDQDKVKSKVDTVAVFRKIGAHEGGHAIDPNKFFKGALEKDERGYKEYSIYDLGSESYAETVSNVIDSKHNAQDTSYQVEMMRALSSNVFPSENYDYYAIAGTLNFSKIPAAEDLDDPARVAHVLRGALIIETMKDPEAGKALQDKLDANPEKKGEIIEAHFKETLKNNPEKIVQAVENNGLAIIQEKYPDRVDEVKNKTEITLDGIKSFFKNYPDQDSIPNSELKGDVAVAKVQQVEITHASMNDDTIASGLANNGIKVDPSILPSEPMQPAVAPEPAQPSAMSLS